MKQKIIHRIKKKLRTLTLRVSSKLKRIRVTVFSSSWTDKENNRWLCLIIPTIGLGKSGHDLVLDFSFLTRIIVIYFERKP